MVVTVGSERGIGGRNQEYALSAALGITGCRNTVIASVDTDGTDGPGTQFSTGPDSMPGCFAGGIVDSTTAAEAEKAGLSIVEGIKKHDTSPILWKLGDGIVATPNISLVDFTVALVGGIG
jgi:glycerate-2-kinase